VARFNAPAGAEEALVGGGGALDAGSLVSEEEREIHASIAHLDALIASIHARGRSRASKAAG
jgi:hypothetical protein